MADSLPPIVRQTDDAGAPFLLPAAVLAHEELLQIKLGDDVHLIPRKEVLAAVVPEVLGVGFEALLDGPSPGELGEASPHGADEGSAVLVTGLDGSHFILSAELLRETRVTDTATREIAERAIGDAADLGLAGVGTRAVYFAVTDVESPLGFTVTRISETAMIPARGLSYRNLIS